MDRVFQHDIAATWHTDGPQGPTRQQDGHGTTGNRDGQQQQSRADAEAFKQSPGNKKLQRAGSQAGPETKAPKESEHTTPIITIVPLQSQIELVVGNVADDRDQQDEAGNGRQQGMRA